MFDAQCDLAAVVYDGHQQPDAVLRHFAKDLNARGFRVVGMVQAGHCADASLSALLLHNDEQMSLAQEFDPSASGCRLDEGPSSRYVVSPSSTKGRRGSGGADGRSAA